MRTENGTVRPVKIAVGCRGVVSAHIAVGRVVFVIDFADLPGSLTAPGIGMRTRRTYWLPEGISR